MKKVSDDFKEKLATIPAWKNAYEIRRKQILEDSEIQAYIQQHQEQLAPDVVERSFTSLVEFYRENQYYKKHGTSEKIPGYRPKLVNDGMLISIQYVPTDEQKEWHQKQILENRVHCINIPKTVRKANLSDVYPEGKQQAMDAVLSFLEQFLSHSDQFHKGLYLWGNFGRGKTYLMGALANKLAEHGYSSTFVNMPSFISDLKKNFNVAQSTMDANHMIDQVKRSPILIMDDIGAESMSDWIRDDVMGVILQYRMQEELPTFFTSNLTMAQYREHLAETKQSVDQLKADRIMERIYYLADEISVGGQNLRR